MNPEVRNPHLDELDTDFLYHLGLDTSMDLQALFGDVKYVCIGGSPVRAEEFARKAAEKLDVKVYEDGGIQQAMRQALRKVLSWIHVRVPLRAIGKTERFSLFKTGPVISVSHGMGMPSMLILLHEITKLLHYAGAENVKFIRIGTSGGVGVEPGTVIITDQALNGKLEPVFEQITLGETHSYDTNLDRGLAEEIFAVRGDMRARIAKTMGTDDFYEGQGRLDGALNPPYDEAAKMAFLRKAYELGVRNIEMEATAFAAFCKRAGISGAIVCAALLDRLQGDQVTSPPEKLAEFSDDVQRIALNFIKSKEN